MPVNRQVLIDSLPEGKLTTDNYRIEESEAPNPGPGEILCRTLVVTAAAGSRAGLQGSASYAAAPKTGIVMQSGAIARVEKSNSDKVSVGDLVSCSAGWQDYSVQDAAKVVGYSAHDEAVEQRHVARGAGTGQDSSSGDELEALQGLVKALGPKFRIPLGLCQRARDAAPGLLDGFVHGLARRRFQAVLHVPDSFR